MTDNVIQFPHAPNTLYDEPEYEPEYEPQTIRIVLPEPTPPTPAANAAVFLAGFAVMFMVITVMLS